MTIGVGNSETPSNICVIGVPEDRETERGAENLFEKILAKSFPNLGKETDIQIPKAQTTTKKSAKAD